MTYHAGIGDGMRELGFTPGEPHITCDGCGIRHDVLTKRYGDPCRWFLNRKPPPGWTQKAKTEFTFSHWCKGCRGKQEGGGDG